MAGGVQDFNKKIIEEFRANQGRSVANSRMHPSCC